MTARSGKHWTLKQRLEYRVVKKGPDDCWLWTGAFTSRKSPHGAFHVGTPPNRRKYLAHRVAYELANGPLPKGLFVLHRCGIHCCCNPKHLYAGTQSDNMYDMHRHGRHPGSKLRGVELPWSKLDPRKVHIIRSRKSPPVVLARKYGVTLGSIWDVINRRTWKHVT